MSKIAKLRAFLKRPPKGWESLSRKDKIAAAAKASGMTMGSVSVAVSTNSDLRSAFGASARLGKRSTRSATPRKLRGKAPGQPGTVLAAKNAIDLLGFDDLLDVSRYLRRALEKRMDAAKKEIRAYR